MEKSGNRKTKNGKSDPLRRVLEKLVLPCMEEMAAEPTDDFVPVEIFDTDSGPKLEAVTDDGFLMRVDAYAIDGERTMLRLNMLAGYFAGNAEVHAMIVGRLIERRAFHVRIDDGLMDIGQMSIGCDLVVRADDEPMVRMRIGDLVRLAVNLEWYFPMWMPMRMSWHWVGNGEVDWTDLPHGDIEGFLATAMEAPPSERTPRSLAHVAQGLGEWKTLLRLFREHPEELPLEEFGPLKMLAHRASGQWLKAIQTAEACGIEDGRFPGAPWMSPSYMHALIEVGEEIEALRLLGPSCDEEPSFYDWLRGLALHRSGDKKGAEEAFKKYFEYWGDDVVAMATTRALLGDEE